MQIFGVRTPLIKPGDDVAAIAVDCARASGLEILQGDIIVFSAKAVGTAQGRLVDLSAIKPSEEALRLSKRFKLDPGFAEVVLRESDEVLGGVERALSTIKKGVLVANGGADQSNAPPGHAALWPEDPQGSAEALRGSFRNRGLDVGVLITDSRTLPLRMGSSAVAIGIAGFSPIDALRGKGDLFGRPMKIKRLAVADDIASAAQLLMGETSESVPIAVVRGAPVQRGDGFKIDAALIPMDECLVMHLMKRNAKKDSHRRNN